MRHASAWRELAGAALASAVLVTLIHLTEPSIFMGVDWLQLHLPARQYLAEALQSFRLPLWNPHVALGRPFLADMETAVFYPPNLIHVVVAPTVAYVVLAMAHATLGFWGMLRLGRLLRFEPWAGWVCAGLFLSTQAVVARLQSGQTHYVQAMMYVPLIFLVGARLGERASGARVLGLAGLLALQVLTGHPQIPWLTWVGLGAFVLARSDWGGGVQVAARRVGATLLALFAAVVGALALAAPTLLPFLELVGQGNRVPPGLEVAGRLGMSPFYWSSLAVPDGGIEAFYWEYNLYSGLAVLVGGLAGLVVTARERDTRGLLATGGVGVLVGSGLHTPVYALFYALVPGASVFRLPARAAFLAVFVLILGLGLLLSRPGRPRLAAAGLGLGSLVACLLFAAYRLGAPSDLSLLLPVLPRVLWLAVTVGALAAVTFIKARRLRMQAALALVAALALDVAVATPPAKAGWVFDVPLEGEPLIQEGLVTRGFYDRRGVPPRLAVPPHAARENAGTVFGWAGVGGFQAVSVARVWVYLHEVLGIPTPDETAYPSPLIFERGAFPYDSMNLVAGLDPVRGLVEKGDPDPRAYVATGVRPVETWREAVGLMRDGHDFHAVALVEGPLKSPLPGVGTGDDEPRALVTSFEPERVVVRTESAEPGVLVLAEAWYPGWEATVDGEATRLFPANAWMRAVEVRAGRHEVVFRFRSRRLGAGLALSALALVALVAWALRDGFRVRSPTASGPPPSTS